MSDYLRVLIHEAQQREFTRLTSRISPVTSPISFSGPGFVNHFSFPSFPNITYQPFATMRFPSPSFPMPTIPAGIGLNTNGLSSSTLVGGDLTKMMYIPTSAFGAQPQSQIPNASDIIQAMTLKSYAEEVGKRMAQDEFTSQGPNIFNQQNQSQELQQKQMMELMIIFMSMLAQMADARKGETAGASAATPNASNGSNNGNSVTNDFIAMLESMVKALKETNQGSGSSSASVDGGERTESSASTAGSGSAPAPAGGRRTETPAPEGRKPQGESPAADNDEKPEAVIAAEEAEADAKGKADEASAKVGELEDETRQLEDAKRQKDRDVRDANSNLGEEKTNLESLKTKYTDAETAYYDARTISEQKEADLTKITSDLDGLKAQLAELEKNKEQNKEQIAALNEQIKAKEKEQKTATDARDAAVADRKAKWAKVCELKHQIEEAEGKVKDAEGVLQAAKDEQEDAQIELDRNAQALEAAKAAEEAAKKEAEAAAQKAAQERARAEQEAKEKRESDGRISNATDMLSKEDGSISAKDFNKAYDSLTDEELVKIVETQDLSAVYGILGEKDAQAFINKNLDRLKKIGNTEMADKLANDEKVYKEKKAEEKSKKEVEDVTAAISAEGATYTKREYKEMIQTLVKDGNWSQVRELLNSDKDVLGEIKKSLSDREYESIVHHIARGLLTERQEYLKKQNRYRVTDGVSHNSWYEFDDDPIRDHISDSDYMDSLKTPEAKTRKADFLTTHSFFDNDAVTRIRRAFSGRTAEINGYENFIKVFAGANFN